MVADTTYYDALGVPPTATELEIKKAYRKLAIITHPDKNPGDETAHERFQAIGEAYQVLSNTELRKRYDQFGKEEAIPDHGFEDPNEFFGMIFGGDAFYDLIGEISLLQDLTTRMEITTEEAEQEELAASTEEKLHIHEQEGKGSEAGAGPETLAASGTASDSKTPMASASGSGSGTSTPRRNLGQQALTYKTDEEIRMEAANISQEEKELRKKEKKKGLTREQQERLDAFELERQKAREERVEMLATKLVDKISVWTETDKGQDVTRAFEEKIRLEVENLKIQSFGLEILHAIGATYIQKATSFLKSQKFLGISGFFSRLKDKGTLAKEAWTTFSTVIDAQLTMEEMAKLEEKGGETWTDEMKAEYSMKVTGKLLAAAWRGSKLEIQSVLRDVCDKVLGDKRIKLEKRIERAHAMVIAGNIYSKAERDPDEEGDYMAFEQLMADGMAKKGKSKEDKKKKKHHHDDAAATAAGQQLRPYSTWGHGLADKASHGTAFMILDLELEDGYDSSPRILMSFKWEQSAKIIRHLTPQRAILARDVDTRKKSPPAPIREDYEALSCVHWRAPPNWTPPPKAPKVYSFEDDLHVPCSSAANPENKRALWIRYLTPSMRFVKFMTSPKHCGILKGIMKANCLEIKLVKLLLVPAEIPQQEEEIVWVDLVAKSATSVRTWKKAVKDAFKYLCEEKVHYELELQMKGFKAREEGVGEEDSRKRVKGCRVYFSTMPSG